MLATDKRILAGHAAGAAEMVGPSDEGGVSDRDKRVGATAQCPPQSSVAGTNTSISQVLLHYLRIEGVRKVFGIPGAAVMDIAYELRQQRDTFQYIICRHESGAAYVADGYSRVTGELGVVIVTSGPGASNALTGAMNAEADGSPLLTITGEISGVYDGKGYLQSGIDGRLNIDQIFAAATDYSAVVATPASAKTLIEQAIRDARGLPHHAAHLSIPIDVQRSKLPSVTLPDNHGSYRTTPASTDPAGIAQMFETLISAKYPLIMLGNSCRRLLQGERLLRFIAFVEKFGIPVITSADGKAVFPETNPWSLRNYGIAACEWPQYYLIPSKLDSNLPNKFDALAVLGSQLGEFATHTWDPALIPCGPFMQVDLDPSVIGRGYPIDLGIVAEVGQVIDAVCDLGDQRTADADAVAQRAAFIGAIKQQRSPWRDPGDRNSTASPVKPPALMKLIGDLTPDGSCIFVDCANAVGWSLGYLALDPPTEIHLALSVAPLGFAIGGVIGARIGRPDATCVALVGDGAFLMHGSEVSTAATYGVGAIWIILDDNNLTMVNQGMNYFYPEADDWSDYYEFNRPDLAMMAKALGADTYSVSTPMEFGPAYLEAIRGANAENRPQVIVVKTDATLVPPFFPSTPPADSTVEKPPDAATPAGP
jgi:acetolactate synthase-1/2/3 large subunit